MDPERWRQIDELFDAVLDLPEAEREAFLAARTVGDEDLKMEVSSLLKAQIGTETFLEKSAMGVAARNLADARTVVVQSHLLDKTIGTYKVESLLGSGGMGEVYLAHDEKLKRQVALKILPAEYTTSDERVKRFQLEARAISALNHPNIVTIYDVGTFDNINYISTEFVEGKTVRELIGSGLKLKDVLGIIIQACEALAAAHSRGIIHRDIKPENIMVRPDGYVKILDFGLAKLSEIDFHTIRNFAETAKGVIIGTPAYMSPEQVADDNVDHRTDLWSIGVVLYELLTGINPFKKENRQATFQMILSGEPPSASSLNPEVPPELDQILIKALEKDADLSYQTASDLRADLKRIKREVDSAPSWNSHSGSRQMQSQGRSGKWAVAGISLLILALVGASVLFYVWRNRSTIVGIDWSKANNVQLTEQDGTEFYPSLSPDGKTFVYSAEIDGNYDIYSQRVDGKNPTNLTPDSESDETQPAFSPEGNRIAFRSDRSPAGIYVMGASRENLKHVADKGFHPSWSPDGKEIVYSTFGMSAPTVRPQPNNGLWIVNVETGQKRELIHQPATFPTWSPNGKRIAYWFYPKTQGRRDIATVAADGTGEPVVITEDFSLSNWNPVWSPDGKFLYFVSDKHGSWNFWRVAIDQETGQKLGEPEPVNSRSTYSRHLSFSADGKRMIYVQTKSQGNIQAVEFDLPNLKTVGTPSWITSGDRELARSELSPDGKQFLTRQARRTQDDIVVYNREDNTWRDVTNDLPYDRYPRWSPDASKIAFTSDRGGGYEIWICNADGTNLYQVTFHNDPTFGVSFPTWSPDGKRLIYNFQNASYSIDLTKSWEQQTPEKLPNSPSGSYLIVWDWSSDGKKLVGYFDGKEKGMAVYSFETKSFSKLTNSSGSIPSFLPDNRHVVFAQGHKIKTIDIETKEIKEQLEVRPETPRTPVVSRDGKLLYYTAQTSESNIWLLDNTNNQ